MKNDSHISRKAYITIPVQSLSKLLATNKYRLLGPSVKAQKEWKLPADATLKSITQRCDIDYNYLELIFEHE